MIKQIASLILVLFLTSNSQAASSPKNIIILFADGVTASQFEYGRYTRAQLKKESFAVTDQLIPKGNYQLMHTESADYFVTDSAAAASAMSTGYKVNNGAISTTPDQAKPETLMAFAKKNGMRIGLVSTAPIYDASPAAFSVHAKSRGDKEQIVSQYFELEPNVLLGGGADYFIAKDSGGKRLDGQNMKERFVAKGYQFMDQVKDLKAVKEGRLLGLFADEDIDSELDRDPSEQPSMAQMLTTALVAINKAKPKNQNDKSGFILFVENENTDTAGHRNDAASLMREMWAFDDAVKVALDFQKKHPDTLIIVTGDHETGGFSPTYGRATDQPASKSNYLNVSIEKLKQIEKYQMSLDEFSNRFKKKVQEGYSRNQLDDYLNELIQENFPGLKIDDDLRQKLLTQGQVGNNYNYLPANILGQAIARQTGIYFASSGHTPAPILVVAYGPGQQIFNGYEDNTQFAHKLRKLVQSTNSKP